MPLLRWLVARFDVPCREASVDHGQHRGRSLWQHSWTVTGTPIPAATSRKTPDTDTVSPICAMLSQSNIRANLVVSAPISRVPTTARYRECWPSHPPLPSEPLAQNRRLPSLIGGVSSAALRSGGCRANTVWQRLIPRQVVLNLLGEHRLTKHRVIDRSLPIPEREVDQQ